MPLELGTLAHHNNHNIATLATNASANLELQGRRMMDILAHPPAPMFAAATLSKWQTSVTRRGD